MTASVIADQKFFGLVELDADGTVLYSRIERDGDRHYPPANITGRNFFSEVAPFLNVENFRRVLAASPEALNRRIAYSSPASTKTAPCV